MDFLEIRKKARERAAAREVEERERRSAEERGAGERASAEAGGRERGEAPGPTATASAPALPADPVVTDADVLEGELAARLQGFAPERDARFTTWRPGEGTPPVPLDEPRVDGAGEPAAGAAVDGLAEALDPSLPLPSGAPSDPLDDFFYREGEEAPSVPPLGSKPGPASEEDPETVVREEYLTFLLGAEEYAVAIERVREVMRAPPITEVPRAPVHVLGVVTVRGEVVAVLDPRRRLGLPLTAPMDEQGRVVIVDAEDGPCGLLVDRVASVVRLRPGTIEPCPQGLGGASADCLAGIGREGDRLFTVLDLGALLRRSIPDRATGQGERHAGP